MKKTECGPGWCRVHGKSALNRVFRHAQVFLAPRRPWFWKTICDIVPENAADAKATSALKNAARTGHRQRSRDRRGKHLLLENNVHAEIAIPLR